MSDLIGRITVPVIAPSGQTFPLKVRWPHGRALARPVVVHTFGSGDAKIEQRYYLGIPAARYTFQSQLSRTERNALRDFWEDMQGCIGSFVYAVPQEDGSTVSKNVCFDNAPLSFDEMASTITTVGLTFIELVDPASAPTYALASTVTRFPDSTLTTALLAQVQEIIPLIKIRVLDGAVDDIFLSDRRVTIGSQLYLPRLLRVGEQGSDVLISQSIPTDGNVPADDASFTFGNADRVMSQLANDTNLQWARIELSFFHTGTGIKIDLWAGYLIDWHFDKGPEFAVKASDILSALARSSPPGTVSRQCARRYGLDGCPAVPGSQVMDAAHFPAGDNTKCDLGYNTPNGCMAHQVQQSYAAVFASPQGVIILDKSSEGGGRLIRPTSIVSDTIYGDTLPEIYHNDEGVPQYGLPVKCKVAAVRDESDYLIGLGLIGKGPLGALTTPQMWDQDGNGTPETFIGSTLDGQPNHGFQVDSTGHLKPGANATFGLRSGLGADPAGAHEYFSLGRVSSGIGLGAPRGWFTNPADSSPMYEEAFTGSAYNKVFAAGIAFLEIRRTDQGGIQPSLPSSHDMLAVVSQGLSGYTWSAPGSRALTGGLTDPFWVAINTYLRALGLFSAAGAAQELTFDVDAAIANAAVASTVVARIFGTGTEKQFQFKGSIDQRRPTRDWLQFVLNNAAGFYTWSFGRLKVGCRYNASVVSAFTAGNMIWNSLTVEPTKPRFEKLTVKFNDQEYLYAANTVDYVDQAYAVRNNRWPAPLSSDLDLPGTVTKSQAGRLVVIRAREELGGVMQSEQDAARLAAWRTTVLALETEAGQVVSITDADFPGGVGKLRILSWRLNRDYSIDITGKTVTASMYDMTTGPKPTDVAASPIPAEGPAVWDPNYETPITNDPIFSAKSFGVKQIYEPDAGSVIQASVDIYGDPPADLSLFFKARREYVSGIFAQVAAAVTTVDATHGTIALGGSGLATNDYVGRVFSKLANVPGSTDLVPIQDFTVTANNTTGTFTVTPDPAAAGCVAGDLFTLRTAPTAFDSTSFTDSKFINPYNTGGLSTTDGGNAGNLALVIAGKGAGQPPRTVVSNTSTKVRITPAWASAIDATSVIVLVEASAQVALSPDFNFGASDQFIGNFPVPNYSGKVVRLEGYTSQGAAEGRLEKAAFREIYLWGDAGGAALSVVFIGAGGQVGTSFAAALRAGGGVPPWTYSIASGSLPAGVTLNSSTGAITGTPTTAGIYTFVGAVTDANGSTANTSSCTITVASASGGSIVTALSSITAADGGHSADTADLAVTRLVSFQLDFTINFVSTPAEYVTLYLSRDNGVSFNWIGSPFLYTASGQTEFITVVRPPNGGAWKIAGAPGTISGDPTVSIPAASLPSGSVVSSTITIAALGLPPATGHNLNFAVAAGSGGNWPYNQIAPDGAQYWSIPSFVVVLNSGAYQDPNIFVLTYTFQDYDASGSAIGPEHPMSSMIPINGVIDLGKLIGSYGSDGSSYVRTDPYPGGTPTNLAFVRARIIASNRYDQSVNAWADFVHTSTRQTDIAGPGVDHIDITVAVGGGLPPGKLAGNRTDPGTLGNNLQLDPATGKLVVPNTNPGLSYTPDSSFLFSTPGVMGSGGIMPSWGYGIGSMSSSVEVRNDGGNSDALYVRLSGADTQVSRTVAVAPGTVVYAEFAARSSNTAGPGHACGIYVDFLDASGTLIGGATVIVGVATGYLSAWTPRAVSGQVTAPAGVASAIIRAETSASESGHWDIDDFNAQPVTTQVTGGVTTSMGQAATGFGTAVYQAYAAVAQAVYGVDYAAITGATYGEIADITPNSFGAVYGHGGGGLVFTHLSADDNSNMLEMVVDDANGPHFNYQRSSGGFVTSFDGTLAAAISAGKLVKAGIIMS